MVIELDEPAGGAKPILGTAVKGASTLVAAGGSVMEPRFDMACPKSATL
jgi:hypothetical protein